MHKYVNEERGALKKPYLAPRLAEQKIGLGVHGCYGQDDDDNHWGWWWWWNWGGH